MSAIKASGSISSGAKSGSSNPEGQDSTDTNSGMSSPDDAAAVSSLSSDAGSYLDQSAVDIDIELVVSNRSSGMCRLSIDATSCVGASEAHSLASQHSHVALKH